jgi:LacI family transcriptional regulator
MAYLNAHPELTLVSPLVVDEADELNPVNFMPWFKKQRPDIVLTHWIGALDQMKTAGAEVPRTHGFICLNLQVAPAHFSGFSQQPKKLGERAAELVIAQLSHGESGWPSLPSTTMLPARWREAATIRAST